MRGGASFAAAAMLALALLGWPGIAAAHDCADLAHGVDDTEAVCAGATATDRPACERAGGAWTPATSGTCALALADAATVRETLAQVTDDVIEWTPWLAPLYGATAVVGLTYALLAAAFRRAFDRMASLVGQA